MEDLMALMVTPLVVFLVFVAPIWLVLHYRSKKQISQGLTEEECQQLHSLMEQAETMADRIGSLERILDAESPDWRSKHGSS